MYNIVRTIKGSEVDFGESVHFNSRGKSVSGTYVRLLQ